MRKKSELQWVDEKNLGDSVENTHIFYAGGSLNLDTFYPIPIQFRSIDHICSLFSLILVFKCWTFARDRQHIKNILIFYYIES